MRYDAHLSVGPGQQRITLDLDIDFKPGDEFTHGDGLYTVTDVQPGHDKFDATLFAEPTVDKPI
jgi:hypothetical protein